MKRQILLPVIALIAIGWSNLSYAQETEVFGFFQSRVLQNKTFYTVDADIPTEFGLINQNLDKIDQEYLSANTQQLNLMLRTELTDDLSGFINFELLTDFSSDSDWGKFSLEEAWVKYDYSTSLKIKGGLLIPKFNNLNEIKNRMPLIPYIVRPLVYEPSLANVIIISNYIPERAFAQVYGEIPTGNALIEYAAYLGNAERGYIVNNAGATGAQIGGTDTTTYDFKLFGGRVGVKYKELRVGLSGSIDKDNQQEIIGEDVPRTRFGVDLGFSAYNFFFDAEYIFVNLSPESTNDDINKSFIYSTLGYNFTEKFYGYGTYSYLEDKQTDFLANGMTGVLFGLGYKVSYNFVLKAQYSNYSVNNNELPVLINPNIPPINAEVELDVKTYAISISVLF